MVQSLGPAPADVLVATKLQLPVLRDDVVERADLLARLRATIAAHKLTLLSAPAGYGKTTLLSALGREHPDLALAWLSLDEDDADPARFLGGLAAALGRLDPACGAAARAMLAHRGDDPLDVRRVVGTLVNDALERLPAPFALVLDDLHVVAEPAVFAALDYLVERMPPQMHVVVASRHDPPLALARLRARGQLAELRAADLRFSEGETEAYLNARRGLGLPDEDVAALQARAEGWAAGLTLLAGSLARIDGTDDRDRKSVV